MLTLKKINDRNKSTKCNYHFLVYEHSHDDIMDCYDLGEKLSRGTKVIPDEWDSKEIRWNVTNDPALKICRLRSMAFERIMMTLAATAPLNYKNHILKTNFYLIDKDGNKITKHPAL